MYCTNCGKEVAENAVACPACGFRPRQERNFCYNCGEAVQPNQAVCVHCGVSLAPASSKSKVTAGLLALFLGGLGIHKFYLGYNKEGLIMLLLSVILGVLTLGIVSGIVATIALVEGIIYLTKSDEEFQAVYVDEHRGWF
mgnify:CR=1 FL=1